MALKIVLPVLDRDYQNYKNALEHLNAEVCFVQEVEDISDYDGLLLPGGSDVDPYYYKEENVHCYRVNRDADVLQLSYLCAFAREKKPVLGICRGHQLINVACGGTLFQHIETDIAHNDFKNNIEQIHEITCEKDSFLYDLYGERFAVNSTHHQAVKEVGKHLRVIARSDDGIIEGMVHESLPIYSVQFHPERLCFEKKRDDAVDGSRLLSWFLAQCIHAE